MKNLYAFYLLVACFGLYRDNIVQLNGLFDTHNANPVQTASQEGTRLCSGICGIPCRFGREYPGTVHFIYAFQTGGKVYVIPHNRIVHLHIGAHVAYNHITRIYTDAGLQRHRKPPRFLQAVVQQYFGLFHADCRNAGLPCVIFNGNRRTEKRNDGVSDIFIDCTLVFQNNITQIG